MWGVQKVLWQWQAEQARQKQKEQSRADSIGTKTAQCLKILGLRPGFTQKELKAAYRKKRSEYHPDKHPNATEQEKKGLRRPFQPCSGGL
ncbi:DnaJ domain-containing protein [Oceanospirillum sediminis]|uniref:DnaJ domain-containing protein n=1 Tax=Oceanospirillum sediminis TaxID=2760088 RepID=A0A839IW65_9GAMM|nr:DnaJ domain-containing protein [Oceanospirillum sediminis]